MSETVDRALYFGKLPLRVVMRFVFFRSKLRGIRPLAIDRNRKYLANYQERKSAGLHFTSTIAESTVDYLINTRQKRNQKMQWSREGAHDILQIRTSTFSKSWEQDWEDAQGVIYKEAA
ncbi:hypothetical protein PsalMR5_04240 (plasmid) [Piscirickettsia salmonis]|uniref:hypothetical protein n=1 Tax=Piscirickettsia salmonis TaxID=1238 RepID=UPI0012BAD03A|nr:hypothetical protein [Piscirickettsia salmonis]QGP56750.1 hypothetical protein PsalSR1_04239 [Piscirickettsia salmonis]QGP61633.1 hypothetical protein PsalBI1_04275 [Piscirickettsia salmonis]QGP66315.1 hypothetical protein PsalMR5_04240 [Piscirickettsia salmonis]